MSNITSDLSGSISIVSVIVTSILMLADYNASYFTSMWRFIKSDAGDDVYRLRYDLRPYQEAGRATLAFIVFNLILIIGILFSQQWILFIVFTTIEVFIIVLYCVSMYGRFKHRNEYIVFRSGEGTTDVDKWMVKNYLSKDKYIAVNLRDTQQMKVVTVEEIIGGFVGYKKVDKRIYYVIIDV